MNRPYAIFAVALALAACGSGESSGSGGSSSSAGSVATAGTAGALGGAPAAGGSAVATGGGGASSNAGAGHGNSGGSTSGGHSNAGSSSGGKVEPGNPCMSGCPSGTVNACWGAGCPLGECDESGFLADAACSSTYSGAVNSNSVYCTANETAGYCMLTITNTLQYWAVNCVNGTPQVTSCPNSCGLSTEGVAGC